MTRYNIKKLEWRRQSDDRHAAVWSHSGSHVLHCA